MAETLFDTTMSRAKAQADPRADAWINHARNMNSRAATRHQQRHQSRNPHDGGDYRSTGFAKRGNPQAKSQSWAPQSRHAVAPRKPAPYNHAEISQYQVPAGTLPYAYAPSSLARKDNGSIIRGWQIPHWKEVLKDLGFLILETALAAIGSAIFAFFTGHRRFHPGPGVIR